MRSQNLISKNLAIRHAFSKLCLVLLLSKNLAIRHAFSKLCLVILISKNLAIWHAFSKLCLVILISKNLAIRHAFSKLCLVILISKNLAIWHAFSKLCLVILRSKNLAIQHACIPETLYQWASRFNMHSRSHAWYQNTWYSNYQLPICKNSSNWLLWRKYQFSRRFNVIDIICKVHCHVDLIETENVYQVSVKQRSSCGRVLINTRKKLLEK